MFRPHVFLAVLGAVISNTGLAADVSDLSRGDLKHVLSVLKNESGGALVIPALDPEVKPGQFKFTNIAPGKTSLKADLELLGASRAAVISVVRPAGSRPVILMAVEIQSLKLSELFQETADSEAGEITLSNLIFSSILSHNKVDTIDPGSLDSDTQLVYKSLLQSDEYSVNLSEDINLLSSLSAGYLPALARETLGLSDEHPLIVEGGVSATLDELLNNRFLYHNQMYIDSVIPLASRNTKFPSFFGEVGLEQVAVGFTYSALLNAHFSSKMNAVIDHKKLEFDASFSHRFVPGINNLEVIADLNGDIDNLFGMNGTLSNVSMLLTVEDGGAQGSLYGDITVGGVTARSRFNFDETAGNTSVEFSTRINKLDRNGLADLLAMHSDHDWGPKLPPELESISNIFLDYQAGESSSFALSGITHIVIGGFNFRVRLEASLVNDTPSISMKSVGDMSWDNAFKIKGFDLKHIEYDIEFSRGASTIGLQAVSEVQGVQVPVTATSQVNAATQQNEFTVRFGPIPETKLAPVKNYLLSFLKNKIETPDFFKNTPLPSPGDVVLKNVGFFITLGTYNSFSFTAASNFLNQPTTVLMAAVDDKSGSRFITGFHFTDLSTDSLIQSNGPLAKAVTFSNLAIVEVNGKAGVDSDQAPAVSEFLSQVSQGGNLGLNPGLQIFARSKISQKEIVKFLDKLGVNAEHILLTADIAAHGIEFKGKVPSILPARDMSFLKNGTLNYTIGLSLSEFSLGLNGDMISRLKSQELDFNLGVQFEAGEMEQIDFKGKMAEPGVWRNAFGIDWLSLSETNMTVSFNGTTESVGLNMGGDLTIGSKTLDADIGIALNAETGVPTAFKLTAKTQSSLGLNDLLALQLKMAQAAGVPVSRRIPMNDLPDLELRPINANTPIEVGIDTSLTSVPQLNVAGTLWGKVIPGTGAVELGRAKVNVGAEEILFQGDFQIGATKLSGVDLVLDESGLHFSSSIDIPFAGAIPTVVTSATECGVKWVSGAAQCVGNATRETYNCVSKTFDCVTDRVEGYAVCIVEHPTSFWKCHEKSCKTKNVCSIRCKAPKTCTIKIGKSGSLEASYTINLRKSGVGGKVAAEYEGQTLTSGSIKLLRNGIEACIDMPVLGNFCARI